MNSKKLRVFLIIILSTFLLGNIFAEGDGSKKANTLNKPAGTPIRAYMNINNISTIIKNTGISDIDVAEANSGLIYPKGSGNTAVFESGLLWGAIVDNPDIPNMGGSSYREGLQGGWIDANGNVVSPDDPRSRIYRVRPDVFPGGPVVDVSSEAADEGLSASAVRTQYELDWTEWPGDLGAPYFDGNGNGQYDSNPTSGDIPGVPGADQTIWYVANDQASALTQDLYGTLPMGIEMQATFWAYRQTGALGSMFFRRYVLINKTNVLPGGPKTFQDMYVSMWSDVDLGNSTDDFAGSDTTLSLVYCYNGAPVDATYNPLPAPAVGFDFFQGPVVASPGDSAIFRGRRVYDARNLPMTAAYYFTRGDATVTDPVLGSPTEGAVRFYRFMQGRVGLTGDPFVDPTTGQPTTFVLNGDPLTGVGWVDGMLQAPGDRRIGSASGPFNMAPGDTQEVVVAQIVAGATPDISRLAAVGLLKYYDQVAQTAYDNFFNITVPPPAPQVNIPGIGGEPINSVFYGLDQKIVLDWGENQNNIRATENYESQGHTFQGYNVYQFPSAAASLSEATRVATFDLNDLVKRVDDIVFDPGTGALLIQPIQFGNDSGIRRYIEITQDAINQRPLINGIRYYFAVTAYSYNPDPDAVPKTLESPPIIYTIIPQSKLPGQVTSEFTDTIPAVRIAGSPDGDGFVYPVVVDPTKLTGLTYTVSFDTMTVFTENNEGEVESEVVTVWNLDRSDGQRLLSNQLNQDADVESPIVDGLQVRVQGAPLDFKGLDVTTNANGPITGAECTYEISQAPSDGIGISADWYRDVLLSPNGGAISGCFEPTQQVAGGYFFIVAGSASVGSHGNVADPSSFVGRTARNDNFTRLIPNNYEIRWTGGPGNPAGKAWLAFTSGNLIDVPFSIWFLGPNLDNPADDIRMMPWVNDENENDIFDFYLDHQASGGTNDPYCDWIYWMMPEENAAPGEDAYNRAVERSNPDYAGDQEIEHLARISLMNWNQNQGAGGENEWPEPGTTFRIRMTVPNAAGSDQFSFTAPQPSFDTELAKADINKINVFPNPYYGINTEELNKYNRFVTFTHLPEKVTIRIFNLAGVLVKTIVKDDASQFAPWNLSNESDLPVASGLYIAYLELSDGSGNELGTKILKLAIIQEQQVLDRF